MPHGRREYKRPIGKRPYNKLFIIATEGAITEPEYFEIFNTQDNQENIVQEKCLMDKHHNAPKQVLKRMEVFIRDNSLRKGDEAWLVIDHDKRKQSELSELHVWSQKSANYIRGFALSNPRFEYWLLLHFEDGKDITGRNCTERLRKYIADYDKGIDPNRFPRESIVQAIQRAKLRDNPQCKDWPREVGTTVYRLVEKILR